MTEEEKKQTIQESELQGKIVVEFRKSGIGVTIENAKPRQVIVAAITLLNQGITREQCDSFIQMTESTASMGELITALKDKIKEAKDEQPK